MAVIQAETIVGTHVLRIWPTWFACPYCKHTWMRGGHKEGFVKSAATNHVAACREIVLFQRGYVQGPEWGTVIPIKQAEALPH